MGKRHEAVIRGAELLDDIEPNWYKRIDQAKLDISDCTACILGQMYGEFVGPAMRIFHTSNASAAAETSIDYGFEAASARVGNNFGRRNTTEYMILTHYWNEQIEKRLLNDGVDIDG